MEFKRTRIEVQPEAPNSADAALAVVSNRNLEHQDTLMLLYIWVTTMMGILVEIKSSSWPSGESY